MAECISRQAVLDRAVQVPMFGRLVNVVAVSEIERIPAVFSEPAPDAESASALSALSDLFYAALLCHEAEDAKSLIRDWEKATARVQYILAADAALVVRCGGCRFREIADYGGGYTKNVCRLLGRQIQNDDFCSYGYGERTEVDDG